MPRTDQASRAIAAPRDQIYAALVDPDARAEWLPPQGMTGRFEHFDARPGGSYRLVLTYDEPPPNPGKATADSDVVDARFVALDPGTRVVEDIAFPSDDPAYAGTMTMSWHLRATDDGTLVEIVAENVPEGISAADHSAGMASSLAKLAAYVER